MIIDRWGNTVFQSNSIFKWDGKYKEKECTEGVYYYIIELEDNIKINNFLTLIK
jgi:gliding motility-associated-like protein